jgi:hypothetical protein
MYTLYALLGGVIGGGSLDPPKMVAVVSVEFVI